MKHTQAPVRCRIAGEGPERESLQALADRLGVKDGFDLLGWVEDAHMAAHSALPGGLLRPYDEYCGYVTVEALSLPSRW
jgi:glycosyltransferase involved in cell wall biosynthesis